MPKKHLTFSGLFEGIALKNCVVMIAASAFLAFGMYNVHAVAGITEGGVLGLNLLLDYWFHISPAVTNAIANLLCYGLGFKLLGRKFIIYSLVSTFGFSGAYKICEQFDPIWPQIADHPLLAAVAGALFVGIGAGLCVRMGGAPSGDDALAMSIAHVTRFKIQWIYLSSDLIVLLLSISYIPVTKIAYSLLTVILSGQVIGWVISFPRSPYRKNSDASDTSDAPDAPEKTEKEKDTAVPGNQNIPAVTTAEPEQ